jgi:transcription elongation factor Elf1
MWLSVIEPAEPGYDKRTFECPRCQHEESAIAKYR